MTTSKMQTKPPFHMIATDVDGTLLNPKCEISDITKQTLQRVVAAYPYQVVVVLASGRHVLDLLHILASLDLPEHCGYIVSSNGACIHRVHRIKTKTMQEERQDAPKEEMRTMENQHKEKVQESQKGDANTVLQDIYHAFIPPEQARKLLTYIAEGDEEINVNIYEPDGWKCSLNWEDQLEFNTMSCFRYSMVRPHERVNEYDVCINKNTTTTTTIGKAESQQQEERPEWRQTCQVNISKSKNYIKEQQSQIEGKDETEHVRHDESRTNHLGQICKIFFGSENTERLLQLQEQIKTDMPDLELTWSSKYCLEVNAAGVTKASALSKLLPIIQSEYLQVMETAKNSKLETATPWTMEQCIAFGDGQNDEVMLRAAGKGCVMGNSGAVLRAHLPDLEVICTNAEDGLAHKLLDVFHIADK